MEEGTGKLKDFYQLLGVPRDASRSMIKRAYRDIALVYHPDSNFFSEIIDQEQYAKYTEMFKEITAAYHTLKNDDKRKKYDQTLMPELPNWNIKYNDSDWLQNKLNTQEIDQACHQQTNRAFGVFGVVGKEPPESAFDKPEQDLTPAEAHGLLHRFRDFGFRLSWHICGFFQGIKSFFCS